MTKVTSALKKLFKKLSDGLKINEESTNLVTGLVRALNATFDATEALYTEASPPSESELARLYEETKVLIFEKFKTVVENSVHASTKGQILSRKALDLCELANQHRSDVPDYVISMKNIACEAHREASGATDAFRKIRVQAIRLKVQSRASLDNTQIVSLDGHTPLGSLAGLLDVLAKDEDVVQTGGGSVEATRTVLHKLVDWWQDIRTSIDAILQSLDHIQSGTTIQLKSIESTWRDLSKHYKEYTSQVQNALDSLEARNPSLAILSRNTPGTPEYVQRGIESGQLPLVGPGSEVGGQALELQRPQESLDPPETREDTGPQRQRQKRDKFGAGLIRLLGGQR